MFNVTTDIHIPSQRRLWSDHPSITGTLQQSSLPTSQADKHCAEISTSDQHPTVTCSSLGFTHFSFNWFVWFLFICIFNIIFWVLHGFFFAIVGTYATESKPGSFGTVKTVISAIINVQFDSDSLLMLSESRTSVVVTLFLRSHHILVKTQSVPLKVSFVVPKSLTPVHLSWFLSVLQHSAVS